MPGTSRTKGVILKEIFGTEGIEDLTKSIIIQFQTNPKRALANLRRAMELYHKERTEAEKYL